MTVVLTPYKYPLLESTYFMSLHKREVVLSTMELPSFLSSGRMTQNHRQAFHYTLELCHCDIFVLVHNVSAHNHPIAHYPLLKPTFLM